MGTCRTIANPVSAPPITDGRPVLGHEHAGVDCVIEGSRKDPRVEDVTRWVGRSALTGWTAGAHIPAIQLPSLPLDEWHYMPHNETVRVRMRSTR
jgi:hypothetical protein